jgi:hypothetical protein
LREVELKIKVVIPKLVSLLRVEKLKQSRRNVSLKRVHANLVDLIDYNDWVFALESLKLFHEDSWLRINVGPL